MTTANQSGAAIMLNKPRPLLAQYRAKVAGTTGMTIRAMSVDKKETERLENHRLGFDTVSERLGHTVSAMPMITSINRNEPRRIMGSGDTVTPEYSLRADVFGGFPGSCGELARFDRFTFGRCPWLSVDALVEFVGFTEIGIH